MEINEFRDICYAMTHNDEIAKEIIEKDYYKKFIKNQIKIYKAIEKRRKELYEQKLKENKK